MLETISNAIKKTIKSDSTAVINSLLHINAAYENLTDEEQIAAGFFALIDGPLKISYGLLMIAGGIILAPIPGIVATVSTEEIADSNGKRAGISGVGLDCRSPRTPCHYTRIEHKHLNAHSYTRTKITGWQVKAHLSCTDPEGTLPESITGSYLEVSAKTTITGYNLATAGLGRVIVGICDPLVGLGKVAFF